MTTDPARYFGKQVRKARLAAGWTLKEFGDRISYSPGQISRIESGMRPPNRMFARACDGAFPGMGGWFTDFFNESREWLATPPWFRPWTEHEQSARVLKIWTYGLFPGLAQAEDYTRVVLACEPGVTEEQISERTAARLSRQRVLTRENPPAVSLLIGESAFYCQVGTAEIMAAQFRHLASVASLPTVTVQVVPSVMHAGTSGSFAVTDDVAYTDTAIGGMVFEDTETVRAMSVRFDKIRSEARPASELAAIIAKAASLNERHGLA